MSLVRNFKQPSYHGKTIEQVYADSGGLLRFLLDNADVGLSEKQTLGISESDMAKLIGLIGIDTSKYHSYQFESNVDDTDTKRYEGNTTFISADFSLTEIDSITFETRSAAATTFTTRASLAALNTYSQSVGAPFYLRITADYDSLYNGFAGVTVNWNL